MNYYSFASYVYYVICEGKMILLNSKRDQYLFLDDRKTALLLKGMRGELNSVSAAGDRFPLEEAIRRKFIIPSHKCHQFIGHLVPPHGVDNHEWSVPTLNQKCNVSLRKKIAILFIFLFVKGAILSRRLDWLFRKIKHTNQRKNLPAIDTKDATDLACTVRGLSLFLPFRTACLENAIVTALLLGHHENDVQFSIGIQVKPFLAHAWVSYEGHVLLDNPSLNEHMMKIVNI